MNHIEKIEELIEDMECLEEAWEIQSEINELESKNILTGDEAFRLQDCLLQETQFKDFDLVSIDDYDWELMKDHDPNLSDQ